MNRTSLRDKTGRRPKRIREAARKTKKNKQIIHFEKSDFRTSIEYIIYF